MPRSSLYDALCRHTRNIREIARIIREVSGDDEAKDISLYNKEIEKIIRDYFPKKRERSPEDEDEEEDDEEEQEIGSVTTLNALTYMYSVMDKNNPYANILLDKMKRVVERIEPTEEADGQYPNLDTLVSVADRIRHFYPDIRGDIPKDTLFQVGKLAKEYHIEKYRTPPRKIERIIDGASIMINAYTEETAPDTLDRAIRETLRK